MISFPLRFESRSDGTHLLTLSVEQVCRQRSLWNHTIVLLFDIPLVVRFECLLELNLLRVALCVMQFSLHSEELLGVRRRFVG